jgi:hypothetical protein
MSPLRVYLTTRESDDTTAYIDMKKFHPCRDLEISNSHARPKSKEYRFHRSQGDCVRVDRDELPSFASRVVEDAEGLMDAMLAASPWIN